MLHYLDVADGTEAHQKRSLLFGSLKDGLIRGTKFDRTAEAETGKAFAGQDPERKFRKHVQVWVQNSQEQGGSVCSFSSSRYPVTLKIWFADEEFPVSGKMFLQDHTDHYLSVEDAVTVGEFCCKNYRVFSSL